MDLSKSCNMQLIQWSGQLVTVRVSLWSSNISDCCWNGGSLLGGTVACTDDESYIAVVVTCVLHCFISLLFKNMYFYYYIIGLDFLFIFNYF